MFIPGETITHEFTIPFADDEISKVIVTYKQNNKIILTKPISSGFEQVTQAKTKITVLLSQQESLLFSDKDDYFIQLNVFTNEGARAASAEFRGSTGHQHYKKVITNG